MNLTDTTSGAAAITPPPSGNTFAKGFDHHALCAPLRFRKFRTHDRSSDRPHLATNHIAVCRLISRRFTAFGKGAQTPCLPSATFKVAIYPTASSVSRHYLSLYSAVSSPAWPSLLLNMSSLICMRACVLADISSRLQNHCLAMAQ